MGQNGRPKGYSKTGGRQAGTPNKVTKTVRTYFEDAFKILQTKNSKVKLSTWGKENPTDFYKLAAKLIPIAVEATGKDGGPIEFNDTQAAAKMAAILNNAKQRKAESEQSEADPTDPPKK